MPSPKLVKLKKTNLVAEDVLNEIMSKSCPTGMKTTLYNYQKVKMINMKHIIYHHHGYFYYY